MGRRYRFLVLLAGFAGCADLAGIGDPKLAEPPPSCVIGGVDLCTSAEPVNTIMFGDAQINSSSDCNVVVYVPPARSVCVIYAAEIVVSATLRGFGDRPLVLAATGPITVTGIIDVSSSRTTGEGAAADDPSCGGVTPNNSYGGGAGGSFIGKGGNGGTGFQGANGAMAGATATEPVPPPEVPRGGCPGTSRGEPGHGGGAIWLASRTAIRIETTGRVLANGGGARGDLGGFFGSPGGGGSGGFIRLAAPELRIAGVVAANGGGGAEGFDNNEGGGDGADGAASSQRAPGGSGMNANGGDGGAGGAGTTPNGAAGGNSSTTVTSGAGGGGGGVGYIQLVGDVIETTGATISPTAQ